MELWILPEPLKQLRKTVEAAGFSLADESRREDVFGNWHLDFTNRKLCIRFVRDRGQWFVNVSGPSCDEWFWPTVWCAYLDGAVGVISAPSIDEQCHIVESRLAEIQGAVRRDPELVQRLLACRREIARRREEAYGHGLPPLG